jgi:hypothetical protein
LLWYLGDYHRICEPRLVSAPENLEAVMDLKELNDEDPAGKSMVQLV